MRDLGLGFFKGFCTETISPFDRVAKFLIPKSTPTASVWFSLTPTGVVSIWTLILTNHLSARRETVADKIVPENLRDLVNLTQPNLGILIFEPSMLN